jgi:hypothetical protein
VTEGEEVSLLDAMMRGVKGDYSYGTIGEQLIPETEGVDRDPLEEFFKAGTRLAVDMATDPLTWAFVGPLKPLGMALMSVPGRVGGKAGKAVVKKLPGMQAVSEKVLPVTTHVRLWGDPTDGVQYGTKLADGLEVWHRNARVPAGIMEKELLDVSKKLGVHRRADLPRRLMAVEHVESGALRSGITHPDEGVQKFAQWINDKFMKTGETVEKYVDLDGKHFRVVHPRLRATQKTVKERAKKLNLSSDTKTEMWEAYLRGDASYGAGRTATLYRAMKRRLDKMGYEPMDASIFGGPGFYNYEFKALRDYVPRMLTDEAMQKYRRASVKHPAVREFAKANGISTIEASRILRKFGQPQRAGNIEYARTLQFPKGDLERDPLKFMPRYYERLFNRMAFGEEFALDGARLDSLVSGMVHKAGFSQRYAESIQDIAKGKRARDYALDSLARKIMGFQVMTKMGPLSALSNISQNVNTFIRDGGVAFTKGILRSTSDEGGRAGVIAWQRGIHDEFLRIAGGEGSVANKYLTWTGFNKAESINRLLASNSSIVAAERALKEHFARGGTVGNLSRKLIRRGIDADDAKGFLANGEKLTQDSADKLGFIGSQATQHATAWKDLPLLWQEPEWRIMLQYKSFIYQQTRFLGREVLGEAQRYFRTGGKEGSIGPLIRAGVGFGVMAEVVNTIRQQTKRAVGSLVGLEYEPEEFNEDHPLWQLIMHSQYVGALGMAGDIVERVTRRDLAGWMLGPTIGDVTDLFEGVPPAIADIQGQGPIEGMPWRKAWQEIYRRIPGIGTLFPRGRRVGFDAEQALVYRAGETGYQKMRGLMEGYHGGIEE